MKNYEMLELAVRGAKADIIQSSGSVTLMEYPIGNDKSHNWITVAVDMRVSQYVTVTIILNSYGEIVAGARFFEVTNLTKTEFDYTEAIDLDNTEAEDAIAHIIDYMDWYDETSKKLIEKYKGEGV